MISSGLEILFAYWCRYYQLYRVPLCLMNNAVCRAAVSPDNRLAAEPVQHASSSSSCSASPWMTMIGRDGDYNNMCSTFNSCFDRGKQCRWLAYCTPSRLDAG